MKVNLEKGYNQTVCYSCKGKDFVVSYGQLEVVQEPKAISYFTFDSVKVSDNKETKKQGVVDYNPVKLFIKEIDQKGNMTIGFNQPLVVPDFAKMNFTKRGLQDSNLTHVNVTKEIL